MAFDNTDIYTRISQLEDTDRKLAHEVSTLHGRLDTALITLTNNVNNLTDAIKALQESQSQTTALQHSMILLQERASVVPEMQKAINGIVIENATNNVLLKGIRFLVGAVIVVVVGIVVTAIWGIPIAK